MGHDTIQTTENGYALLIDSSAVDVERFHELSHRARRAASGDPLGAAVLLEEALAIGTGQPFGEAAPDGPLAAAATRMAEECVDVAALHAQTMLNTGRHREVVAVVDELILHHPYREGLWATLAVALYRCDRQGEALRRLADARRVLEEDLGVTPGPRLVEIEQQILTHDAALVALDMPIGAQNVPAVMVGRSDELTRLRDRLHQTSAGAQHTIFIGGEPGIGKTTIARELTRTAVDRHTVVLTGRCDEHVAVPYRPFIEAITDHVRTIGEDATSALKTRWSAVTEVVPALRQDGLDADVSLHPGRSSAELTLLDRFDTFGWMLQQLQGPGRLVLILEDLHWADSATLRLLHYLIGGHRLPGSLLIGTHRTTEPPGLLNDILADLRTEPQVERMSLGGLRTADLLLLMPSGPLSSDHDTAGWIYRETDGNPFLAVEIIDHIAKTGSRDEVPVGVSEVVARRLRRLSSETQTLLKLASVLGEAAPVSLLRQFAGVVSDVPAALAEATQAGILTEEDLDERHYRFTHAIIRKAATAAISGLQLEDLHVAAAEA